MKKRIVVGILIVIFIMSVLFIIPVRKEEKEVWYSKDLISFGHSDNFYYNIYGIRIWPYLSEYEHIRE